MKFKLLFIIACISMNLSGAQVERANLSDDDELALLLKTVSNLGQPGRLGIFGVACQQRKLVQHRKCLKALRSEEASKVNKCDYLVYNDGQSVQVEKFENGLLQQISETSSFDVASGFERGTILYRIEFQNQTVAHKYIDEIKSFRKDKWKILVSCSDARLAHELYKAFQSDGNIDKIISFHSGASFYRSVFTVGIIAVVFVFAYKFLYRR